MEKYEDYTGICLTLFFEMMTLCWFNFNELAIECGTW